jgi:FG-GAP-like repeat
MALLICIALGAEAQSRLFLDAPMYGTGTHSNAVAVGDFNGDGKPDLAVANDFDNDVSVLLGNGDGTFQVHVDYGAGYFPLSVAVGDFNGDGKPDLAVANATSNNVSVLLGNNCPISADVAQSGDQGLLISRRITMRNADCGLVGRQKAVSFG